MINYTPLKNVISPWAAEGLSRAVAGILVQELQNNQPELGADKKDAHIAQVVNGIWGDVDASLCPLVNVYLAGHNVAEDGGILGRHDLNWHLFVDIYAASSETEAEDMTLLAARRLNYLARQVWVALHSESGFAAITSICKDYSYKGFQIADPRKDQSPAISIVTGQLSWTVRMTEAAEQVAFFDVAQFLSEIGLSDKQKEKVLAVN